MCMDRARIQTWCRHLVRESGLSGLWALYRAWQQERRIRRERAYYGRRARRLHLQDELDETTLQQHLRQRLLSRSLVPKARDKLHVIYATPLGIWEKHNIPPALQQFGTLTPFYLKEHGFDDTSDNWLQVRPQLDQALLHFVTEAHRHQPVDVFLSYLSGWYISPETIHAINQLGIVTCAFWWDDRLSFRGRFVRGRYTGAASLASAYDVNLTNAPDSIAKYLVEGGLAMFWPEAANPDHFRPLQRTFEYDVSFVGGCYGQRPVYIDYLKDHGVRVEAFGPGWSSGPVSAENMVEIYNRSRINLGFSGIGYSMKEMCLKGRDFEVPMCGALYLASAQPDLHRVYNVGQEVVTYRSKADCLAKTRYLLAHPDECACIRQAARQRCVRDHTWERRFHDLFQLMGLLDD